MRRVEEGALLFPSLLSPVDAVCLEITSNLTLMVLPRRVKRRKRLSNVAAQRAWTDQGVIHRNYSPVFITATEACYWARAEFFSAVCMQH